MSTENLPVSESLDAVLKIIQELASKSSGHDFVYRGEPALYDKVSSSLYRRFENIEDPDFDIAFVEREIVNEAAKYTRYSGESTEIEILSQLRHNGGDTNLIDFTTDYLIALFFACDGAPNEHGRVVMLSKSASDYDLEEPSSPIHRVIAQKSVLVRPSSGFVQPNDFVTIPSGLKSRVLDYLRDCHGISTETIYNDINGFITHQGIHQSAYTEFYHALTLANNGDAQLAIEHYTKAIDLNRQNPAAFNNRGNAYADLGDYKSAIEDYQRTIELDPNHAVGYSNLGLAHYDQGNYQQAVRDYDKAIELDPNHDSAYCNRGEALLHLAEWDRAREDLLEAKSMEHDIIASFQHDYASVAEFESKHNLQVPKDIAAMLGG